MAITILGSAVVTSETGASGRGEWEDQNSGTTLYFLHPHGSKVTVWNVDDPTAPFIVGTSSTIAAVQVWNSAGGGFVESPTSIKQYSIDFMTGVFTPGAEAAKTLSTSDGNQRGGGFGYFGTVDWTYPDGSDLHEYQFLPVTGFFNRGSTNVGGTIHGLSGAPVPSDPGNSYIFATAGGNLVANIQNFGPPTTYTPVFSVAIAAGTGRSIHAAVDGTGVIAIVVDDGGNGLVELRSTLDGSLIGAYANGGGDTIVDCYFTGSCLFVLTDGATDNLHTVDASDQTAPVFATSDTLPYTPIAFQADSHVYNPDSLVLAITGNDAGTSEPAIMLVSYSGCGGVTPPDGATGKLAVFALGSRLYVGDDDPKLEVFDISNPAAPSSLGTLVLADNPTDIWVNESNCYISFHGGFYKINIDDPALMTLTSTVTTGDDFDYLSAPGGTVYLSGEAARLAAYNPGSAPPAAMDEIPIISGGISAIALEGTRVFFADVAPGGTSILYSYGVGGFSCHTIAAGVIGADYLTTEEIYARHGKFKGDLVARSLLLTEMLATTGIVLVDTDDGSLQLLTIASGVVVVTPL